MCQHLEAALSFWLRACIGVGTHLIIGDDLVGGLLSAEVFECYGHWRPANAAPAAHIVAAARAADSMVCLIFIYDLLQWY